MLFGGHAVVPLLLGGVLVLGVIVLVGWGVVQGFQKSNSAWRAALVSLLMTLTTIAAFVGWWFVGIYGRIGGLVPFHSPWANLLWLGFLVILIAGVVSTVWLTGRLGRDPNQTAD